MLRPVPALAGSILFALPLASCDTRSPLPDLEFVVFDAQGADPLEGRSLVSARAYFQRAAAGAVEDFTETPIEDGTFDLVVPIDDISEQMTVRLELSSEAGVELLGATPYFYPAQAGRVGVIVGEPGTCDVAAGLVVGDARSSFGLTQLGIFVLVTGGLGDAGAAPLAEVDVVELLGYSQYELVDATEALGATRSVAIDDTAAVVLPSLSEPYVHRVYAAAGEENRPVVALHAGAELADAALRVPGIGAVVIGGGEDAAPSNSLSWVLPQGASSTNEIRTRALNAAEPDRTAAVASNGVWIVSRGAGATTLEQLTDAASDPVVRLGTIADGVRLGAQLVANAAGTDLLLIGGVDELGDVRTDTLRISGCPESCVVSAGPTWANPRTGFATDDAGYIVGGVAQGVPSGIVERLRFGSTGWVIDAVATLANARRDARVLRLPGGSLFVFGGIDAAASRSDVEVCFLTP